MMFAILQNVYTVVQLHPLLGLADLARKLNPETCSLATEQGPIVFRPREAFGRRLGRRPERGKRG